MYTKNMFLVIWILSKIRMVTTCSTLRNWLDITGMHNIDGKYKKLLTQSIIDMYINPEKLDASYNRKITNVNHLAKLEILNASWNYGINDAGIMQCVNLKTLNAFKNPKITKKLIK